MCGVTGLWRPGGGDLSVACRAARDRLAHRGPDDAGLWTDPDAGVALGHRRLAVIDLSPSGHQPMVSASGRLAIAFNGEIYNFAELRADLEAVGVAFRGHSDTEVLLEAIERWGLEAACRRSNGMFALALWDRRERRLSLARDRFGQKPLYYGWLGDQFGLASELKALRLLPGCPEGIDPGALVLFLRHGYVPAPRTIYQGLAKLPAGCVLHLDGTAAARREMPLPSSYWSAIDVASGARAYPFTGSETEATDTLEELLTDAVGRCMVADVPVGAFLSGGIDSSTVVALMRKSSARPPRTFSIGFEDAAFNEAPHAAAVALHLGTEHLELTVTAADVLNVVPLLPEIFDEPFADPSQLPTVLLSKLVRGHVTVSLSGDGGDELFGGYTRYGHGALLARLMARVPNSIRQAGAVGLTMVPVAAWDCLGRLASRPRPEFLGDKLHKLAHVLGAADVDAAYLNLVSLWHDPVALAGGPEPDSPVLAATRAMPGADSVSRMMLADTCTYLTDDILVKVDRASMAVALEARVPLLDHRLYEFAWSLPSAMKRRGGVGKWLLRQVLYRHVPQSLIERPKMGFGVPIDDWLREPLREWADALLAPLRLRDQGLLNADLIARCWQEHQSGRRNWQYALWAVLMLQAWLDNAAHQGPDG